MLRKLTKLVGQSNKRIAATASMAMLCCGLMSGAQAIPFSQISQVYFFGDSLTDSGFNDLWDLAVSALPTGKAPTFTTFSGYVWAQYIARDIKGFTLPLYPAGSYPFPNPADTITNNTTPLNGAGPVSGTLTGVDYAAAGSTTNSTGVGETWAPSLHTQIQHFISTKGGRLDPNAVYFIWAGANDFLALLSGLMPSELQLLMTAQTAAINIANEVAILSQHGAKRVVVMSLPNIGITPLITQIANGGNIPTLPASMKTATYTFNSLLNQQLGQIIAQYGVKVLYVDVYTLLDNVIIATQAGRPYQVAGQSFQFVNYTQPACGNVPAAIYCPSGTPTGYVFADTLHPTDMAHRLLSLQVETLIEQWA